MVLEVKRKDFLKSLNDAVKFSGKIMHDSDGHGTDTKR